MNWGLLPDEVRALVVKREWRNEAALRARLTGDKAFPLRIGLKPPQGNSAVQNLEHFRHFVAAWQRFSQPELVEWESRTYRKISRQDVPVALVIQDIRQLLNYLGAEAVARSQRWEQNMSPLLALDSSLYPALVKHLNIIEAMTPDEVQLLASLLPQLEQGMGQGLYLRALPLVGVDTKFLESYQTLVSDLLDVLHAGEVTTCSGLLNWLGCQDNPRGWLTIRPLCQQVERALGGHPVLQLPADHLLHQGLSGSHILIVENLQSGLGLPELKDSLAIVGGGRNTAWTRAEWLQARHVGYWGDIDTWGLQCLSDVRSRLPDVTALMMDEETLLRHQDRMVVEPEPIRKQPACLTESELQLFNALTNHAYPGSRLEQERLAPDYIRTQLSNWV